MKTLYVLYEGELSDDDDTKVLDTAYTIREAKEKDDQHPAGCVWYAYNEDEDGNLSGGLMIIDIAG